jgi:hypothetical protein
VSGQWIVVMENEEYRLWGAALDTSDLGAKVLELLECDDLVGARRWLASACRSRNPGLKRLIDPFAGPPFARLWVRGEKASAEEARMAAA